MGLVGININISPMQDIVNGIKPYETGIATVYANNGMVAAHNIPDRTGKSLFEADRSLYE
jgi:methyl-accepting chemotaxis protein